MGIDRQMYIHTWYMELKKKSVTGMKDRKKYSGQRGSIILF
uniref:Uncharacterized protein n=1 Tax=Rhizophora mucronata TaxID=61149 RepID=A0A2P2J4V4_RHIMU